ncbi:MAG: hypothetical protein FVQ81_15420 [Candidatus Glassbacteria bacterium]|nr:hypothetical protein [Candidatus Glassbacteria bacterium]
MAKIDIDLFKFATGSILGAPGELAGEDAVNYVAVLLEISRVGGVSVEERKFQFFVERNLGIEAEEIEQGRAKAKEHEGALADLVSGINDPEIRVHLFRDAYLMTLVGGLDNVELQVMDRLAGALGLSRSLANKIFKMVDDLVQLHKDFLDVLEQAGIE